MYIIDGIAYAGEPVEGIEVSHARYVGERILLVTFSTGETRLFDASCLLSMPPSSRLRTRTSSRISGSNTAS